MEQLTKRHLRSPEFIIDYVLQLCLVVGLAGLMVLFWPEGMFRTPIGLIPLGDWFWALVSALLGGLTALIAQWVLIKTVAVLLKVIRPGGSAAERLPASDSEPFAPGGE